MEEVLSSSLAGSALPGDLEHFLCLTAPSPSILGTSRGNMLGINTHLSMVPLAGLAADFIQVLLKLQIHHHRVGVAQRAPGHHVLPFWPIQILLSSGA